VRRRNDDGFVEFAAARQAQLRRTTYLIQREGDVIALHQFFGERGDVRDDRLQLVSGSGEPIVTFRDDSMDGGELTERFLTLNGYYGKTSGNYVYDLESGELLKVSDGAVKFGSTLHGEDDLLTWATPVNRRHGMKLWAVEFHPR